MLKYDLFSLKTAVPETKFFERLFALMRQYHMNNVLHNEIVKIISFVLETDEGTSLLPNVIVLLFSCLMREDLLISCLKKVKKIQRFKKSYYLEREVSLEKDILDTLLSLDKSLKN